MAKQKITQWTKIISNPDNARMASTLIDVSNHNELHGSPHTGFYI